jgi:hypothetical protein
MPEPFPPGTFTGPAPPPLRLARGITWMLVAKAAALALLYIVFFSPAHRPDVTPGRVADTLLNPATHAGPATE